MDNDKQKSAENSASPRPGIFSTPDLTVDTEKLAQAVPSADSNKSRIASVFANTDATRQAQQSTITSTPLEGDIVLNGTPKKRSKVPIIILIAAILTAILVTVAVIVFSKTEQVDVYERVKTAFLEYANFALHGETSSRGLNVDCTKEKTCYFMQAMQSKGQFEKFYKDSTKLKERLEEEITIWGATTTDKNSGASDANGTYNEEFDMTPANKTIIIQELQGMIDIYDFLPMFAAHEALTESSIIDYFLENGEAKTRTYIAGHCKANTGNRYFDELNQGSLLMGEAVLDNVEIYAQLGCLDNTMNTACFLSQAAEEEKEEVNENNMIIADYYAEMSAYANMPEQFINRIKEINILFNRYESEQK